MSKVTKHTPSAGFTLLELLIVVSIVAIITGAIIPGFNNYLQNQNIRQAQEQIKNDLRTVQNKALTGVNSDNPAVKYWGIKMVGANVSQYLYVTASTNNAAGCNSATQTDKSIVLPGNVVVTNGTGNFCVFFSLPNGDGNMVRTGGANYIRVGYAGAGGNCGGIAVNSGGLITLTAIGAAFGCSGP